jgi:hypothetical protein
MKFQKRWKAHGKETPRGKHPFYLHPLRHEVIEADVIEWFLIRASIGLIQSR